MGKAKERVGTEQAGPGQVSTAAQPGRMESQSRATVRSRAVTASAVPDLHPLCGKMVTSQSRDPALRRCPVDAGPHHSRGPSVEAAS